MKNKHCETDSERVTRLENLFKNPVLEKLPSIVQVNCKIYDCSQCGKIYKTKEQFMAHGCTTNEMNNKELKCKVCDNNITSSEDMNQHMLNMHPSVVHDIIVIEDLNEDEDKHEDTKLPENCFDIEYETEVQPKGVEKEKRQRIKFFSNSEDFTEGINKMKELITKGSIYNVDGCEIKVKEDIKEGKITKIEVRTEELNGTTGIKFCSSKKHGTAVVISRLSKQDFALVSAVACNFVKPILDSHLNKTLTTEFIKRLKVHTNIPTKENQIQSDILAPCDQCDYISKNQHGLSIHHGKTHTDKPPHTSQKPKVITPDDIKSQTNSTAKTVKSPGKKLKCDQCDYESMYQKFLKDHIKRKHEDQTKATQINNKNITIEVCNICKKWFNNERELRHHKVNVHITDKDAIIGTKRDESFLIKTASYSPKRKRRLIEEQPPNSSLVPPLPSITISQSLTTPVLPQSSVTSPNITTQTTKNKPEKNTSELQKEVDIQNELKNSCKTKTTDPRVKDLPILVKEVVNNGSKEVESTGNGSCLIGTTSLHITGDEEQTHQIARNLNTHLAQYRNTYLPKIAADFPFTITIGTNGKTKVFKKGEENKFFDWLAESEEAILMWRGCVDIIAVSNMLQMDVDCIVYQEGKTPEVRYFSPDPKFPWHEDDEDKPKNNEIRKYNKMTILNYKDTHFNLVVEQNSMIAESGTFSFQRKIGTKGTTKTTKDQVPSEDSNSIQNPNEYIMILARKVETLEKALCHSQNENKKLQERMHSNVTNYENKEFSLKCSECELSFQDNEALKNHLEKEHFNFKFHCQTCKKGFNQKTNLFYHNKSHEGIQEVANKCFLCDINFKSQNLLTDHNIKQHPKENDSDVNVESGHNDDSQHNCKECDFQTNDKSRIEKHVKLAHMPLGQESEQQFNFKCVTCAQGFSIKSSLLKHRLDAHGKSKVKCRYSLDNTCKNGANNGEKCLYDHTDGIHKKNENLTCNICGENFKFQSQFLKHRKTEHPDTVPTCKTILKGEQCSFGEGCGFSHAIKILPKKPNNNIDQEAAEKTDQIFQEGQNSIKPPDLLEKLMTMVQLMMVDISILKQQAGN